MAAEILHISTKRPAMDVEIDGEVKSLPVSLNSQEFGSFAKLQGEVKGKDKNEASVEFVEWFLDFASKYLGDDFRQVGSEAFTPLLTAWLEQYNEANGVSAGER